MRLLAVTGYQDPAISSYDIMEDRNKMQEAINFADYNQSIKFGFFADRSFKPVALDPRIGSFTVSTQTYDYSKANGGIPIRVTQIPL